MYCYPGVRLLAAGEAVNVAIDMQAVLDEGELLAGAPTVQEMDALGHLTFSNQAINASNLTVLGKLCVPGQAWQFHVSGIQGDSLYRVRVSGVTDSSPAQTRKVDFLIHGIP